MKKRTKAMIGIVAVIGVLAIVANRYIAIYQDRASFSNIGGSDGSTTICIADKVLRGDKEVAHTSITMEKTREIFQTEGDIEK